MEVLKILAKRGELVGLMEKVREQSWSYPVCTVVCIIQAKKKKAENVGREGKKKEVK